MTTLIVLRKTNTKMHAKVVARGETSKNKNKKMHTNYEFIRIWDWDMTGCWK